MRLVKLTSLLMAFSAIVVMAATASASATVLCKASEETCKSENQYLSGTAITASLAGGASAKLTSGLQNIVCTSSTLKEKTNSGTPLAATLSSFSQSGCTSNIGGATCTFSASGLPANSTLSTSGGGNGNLSVEGASFQYFCNVLGGVTCNYSASPFELTLNGGSPAGLAAPKVSLSKQPGSSGFCSNTATWAASYTVISPNPLYVSNGTPHAGTGTALCKEEVNPCPAGSRYSEGQSIEGSTSNLAFNGYFGASSEMNCSATLKGQVGGVSGSSVNATISSLLATGCVDSSGLTCSVAFAGPYSGQFATTAVPNGTLGLSEFTPKITCSNGGISMVCRYRSPTTSLSVQGGLPATIGATKLPLELIQPSSGSCASTSTMTGSFPLSTPSPLYLESAA